jgi:hypothetical protein
LLLLRLAQGGNASCVGGCRAGSARQGTPLAETRRPREVKRIRPLSPSPPSPSPPSPSPPSHALVAPGRAPPSGRRQRAASVRIGFIGHEQARLALGRRAIAGYRRGELLPAAATAGRQWLAYNPARRTGTAEFIRAQCPFVIDASCYSREDCRPEGLPDFEGK